MGTWARRARGRVRASVIEAHGARDLGTLFIDPVDLDLPLSHGISGERISKTLSSSCVSKKTF